MEEEKLGGVLVTRRMTSDRLFIEADAGSVDIPCSLFLGFIWECVIMVEMNGVLVDSG